MAGGGDVEVEYELTDATAAALAGAAHSARMARRQGARRLGRLTVLLLAAAQLAVAAWVVVAYGEPGSALSQVLLLGAALAGLLLLWRAAQHGVEALGRRVAARRIVADVQSLPHRRIIWRFGAAGITTVSAAAERLVAWRDITHAVETPEVLVLALRDGSQLLLPGGVAGEAARAVMAAHGVVPERVKPP